MQVEIKKTKKNVDKTTVLLIKLRLSSCFIVTLMTFATLCKHSIQLTNHRPSMVNPFRNSIVCMVFLPGYFKRSI